MAQGEFTKQEADATIEAVKELIDAIPKVKKMAFFGHANDIFLFLQVAKKNAPDKPEDTAQPT